MTYTTRFWPRWESHLHFLGIITPSPSSESRYTDSALQTIEKSMKEKYPGDYKVELVSKTGPERLKLKFKDEKSEAIFHLKYGV